MKKILILLLAAALLCFGFSALAENNVLQFDRNVNRVFEGETLQTVLIREGAPAGGELSYTSANEKVATVDENGVVTGVSKGQTNITATVTAEGKTYRNQLNLFVDRKAAEVQVQTAKLPLYPADDPLVAPLLQAGGEDLPVLLVSVKKQINLQVTVLPQDASNRKFVLKSDNDSVLKVQGNGLTGLVPGEAVLTVASASNPEVSVRYRVLVIQPVTRLTVEASGQAVTVGGQVTVKASVMPENASIPQVIWSSGDERILTVDAQGVVTGLKRGNGRLVATAADGSNIRANFSLKVVQNPEAITLGSEEMTVDVGRNQVTKYTVAPVDADNKRVIWSSSDESIAKVGKDGRITGVAPGECVVTCRAEALESVSAELKVHVQQPVKSIAFTEKSAAAYAGETTQLSWITEPANATNPGVTFQSSNPKVAVVDENGVVTGVSRGNASITATTVDGSRRKAQIQVRVGEHVTGVQMVREHAYIDLNETATAGATIYPKDATNKNMTWVSSDESVVTANGKTNSKMKLKGVGYGEATVTGTTEDGGFQTSLRVTVGDFDRSLTFRSFDYDKDGNFWLSVRNDSAFTITRIVASLEVFDGREGVAVNTKDGSNKVDIVWSGALQPGETTGTRHWKMVNYSAPSQGIKKTSGTITLYQFQIDNDWIKTIRERHRTKKDY